MFVSKSFRSVFVSCVLLVLTSLAPAQTVWYVNDDASGAYDGSSWTDAFTSVEPASYLNTLDIAQYRLPMWVSGHQIEVPYARTHPLDQYNPAIIRAIVVIHGSERTADFALSAILGSANTVGEDERTIIIAPQFLIEEDIVANGLGAEVPFWGAGWRQGNLSFSTTANPRPVRISSYQVIDHIATYLADRSVFPNLQRVVIAGHSAGGQFAQRYAAGGLAESQSCAAAGIEVRYVVANPSSSVYLDNLRARPGTLDIFEVPSPELDCPTYNLYKYGLDGLNFYMNLTGAAGIQNQYPFREVVYLSGELDANPDDPGLERNCQAMLQGVHRLERGTILFNHLRHRYGVAGLSRQYREVMPGVGHSSIGTYNSPAGRRALFSMIRFNAADLNGDGYVDLEDFDIFEACFSGEGIPHDGSELCQLADFDGDGDVDCDDFAVFVNAWTGPPDDPPAFAPCEPISLTGAVSRRMHGTAGTFDIELPVGTSSEAIIEPRTGGPTQVVLTFSGPADGVSVETSAGSVEAVLVDGEQAIVELSGYRTRRA